MKSQKKYFRSLLFFKPDFPFSIIRNKHAPNDYDDSVRCNREFWKIIYINEGHGWKVINSKKYPLKAGSIFLIHPDDTTTFNVESDYIDIYNIIFMPEFIDSIIKDLSDDFNFFSIFHNNFYQEIAPEEREWLYVLQTDKAISLIVKDIEREYENQAPNYRNAIKFRLLDLLIHISRLSIKKVKLHRKSSLIHFINHIIERHYAEEFDFDYLAAEMGLTKSHICRVYRLSTDTTISQVLREKRISVAKDRLLKTNKTISEICYECGFNDLSYFYRTFKKSTGLNPGHYRKQLGLY
jgi:AraC-like DNA-binding protein